MKSKHTENNITMGSTVMVIFPYEENEFVNMLSPQCTFWNISYTGNWMICLHFFIMYYNK